MTGSRSALSQRMRPGSTGAAMLSRSGCTAAAITASARNDTRRLVTCAMPPTSDRVSGWNSIRPSSIMTATTHGCIFDRGDGLKSFE